MKSRPNIVVILADDLGYGDIGCFGNADVRTPHIDRLASEGISLTQHYSASPMCAPARAGLLTGRYPHRVGAIDVVETRGLDRIALGAPTAADLLKAQGYAAGMVGKWHNGAIDPRFHPAARGFEEFVGFQGGAMDYWKWIIERNGSFERADGRYLTDVFSDEAIGFIERHRRKPFFLYVAYNAPHTPLQAPEGDVAPFREMGRFTSAVSILYGMVRRMDAGIGRILEALDRLELSRNTLVLFASDNGPMFMGKGDQDTRRYNRRFNGSKGDVLEGGIRVPAIVRWPDGLPAGVSCHGLIHFCDWLPGLLSAAGAETPDALDLDGGDALPALRGKRGTADPVRFWQWNRYTPVRECNAAMRDGPWKLYRPSIPEARTKPQSDNRDHVRLRENPTAFGDIVQAPFDRLLSPPRDPMLFNLDDDPYEQKDLAAEHPDRVSSMQKSLAAWFEKVEAERAGLDDETRGYPECLTNDRFREE
ncbi:MAG: sulfatase-like hydrolase/transferase [Planctomycetota bacterium]